MGRYRQGEGAGRERMRWAGGADGGKTWIGRGCGWGGGADEVTCDSPMKPPTSAKTDL